MFSINFKQKRTPITDIVQAEKGQRKEIILLACTNIQSMWSIWFTNSFGIEGESMNTNCSVHSPGWRRRTVTASTVLTTRQFAELDCWSRMLESIYDLHTNIMRTTLFLYLIVPLNWTHAKLKLDIETEPKDGITFLDMLLGRRENVSV